MSSKLPTNTDLGKKIDKLSNEVSDMNIILLRHDDNLMAINKRHELADFAKKILDEHAKQQQLDKDNKVKDGIGAYQLKAWHLIVGLLMVLTAIAYAIAARNGIKP